MIVIADTSPLNYLVLIGQIDLLPALYGDLIIPRAVHKEMLSSLAPPSVRQWAETHPSWLLVQDAGPITLKFHPKLNAGEREAITLAHNHPHSLLLIDEWLGRQEAQHFGLNITGTLGILRLAHLRGLLDLHEALANLKETNFQASEALLQAVLKSVDNST